MKSLPQLLALLLSLTTALQGKPLPTQGQCIVFLGDSNTYAGHYIDLIEAAILQQAPELDLTLLNLGLNGETCSGLSEPDHPYPRPSIHGRLCSVLAKTRPDIVVVAYGMNDGIYHPQSQTRFNAYKQGIQAIVRKVHPTGAKLYLLSPPPFDATPLRSPGKVVPNSAGRFAWFSIYEGYDEVLTDYTNWLLTLQDPRIHQILNIRSPLLEHQALRRQNQPGYLLMHDGVHFNLDGHKTIANLLLQTWGFCPKADNLPDGLTDHVRQRQRLLRDAWLTHCGHQRPDVKPGLPPGASPNPGGRTNGCDPCKAERRMTYFGTSEHLVPT